MLRVPADHSSIQAAIEAATVGDEVIVEAGVYKERIQLKLGVALRSQGDNTVGELGLVRAERTIIDGAGDDGQAAGVEMAEGSTLDGFTIRNVGVYDDTEWRRHYETQGEEQEEEPIGAAGIAGIAATGVSCTIQNNIVHHIGYTGIGITGAEGKTCSPVVMKNICFRNMGGGIGSMRGSTAIIRQNTCFENFYAGIGHSDASPLVLENVCYGNVRAGIGISEGSCPVVRGNKCYGNRRAGIGIRTGHETQPLVEDNDCYDNDMAGIGTREEAAPIIRGNRCYRNKLAGIGSRTAASPVVIGNECYENASVGIGQQSNATTVLIGNFCHHNNTAGIGFDPCDSGESTLLNNRVIDNKLVAVGIQAGWKVQLAGNELARKGGLPPIVMVFEGAEAVFVGNTIRGEGVAGIRAAGIVRISKNIFEGTSLRKGGPPNFAVWALPGSRVTMSENRIRGWRNALHATESTVTATGNTVSQFHKAAFVLQQPTARAIIAGNQIFSGDEKDVTLMVNGKPIEDGENERVLSDMQEDASRTDVD
ncbi:MAG: right-handed parallel beta-helix repeat-containing protein [Planctomycetales bacterium]|nr:right-handed parallel beta-helix repeat-containing protein [Planctomycetales bacterium]